MGTLESLVKKTWNYIRRDKAKYDRYIDPALIYVTGNAAALYGANIGLNAISSNFPGVEGPAMLGGYAMLGVGLVAANQYLFHPFARYAHDFHQKRVNKRKKVDRKSVIRTGVQIAALGTAMVCSNFMGTLNDYKMDYQRVSNAIGRTQMVTKEDLLQDDTQYLKQSQTLSNMIPKGFNWSQIENTSIHSTVGKYYRTSRWEEAMRNSARRYGIPDGLLQGTAMQEGGGNPLQLNYANGGDAGNFQFMPGTAQQYGLKVYGNSKNTRTDRNYGRKLQQFLKENDYDYDKISKIDERFDVEKSADAAARYLKDLNNKYHDWDKSLSAWNRGTPAEDPTSTAHVKAIRDYQKFYLAKLYRR
jgi:hypothetical protein